MNIGSLSPFAGKCIAKLLQSCGMSPWSKNQCILVSSYISLAIQKTNSKGYHLVMRQYFFFFEVLFQDFSHALN